MKPEGSEHDSGSRLEDGMVTVEIAVGMAALIAVLALLVGALAVMKNQAEVCQAVREGARAASVGTSGPAAVTERYPRATNILVSGADQWVRVSASAPVQIIPGWQFSSVQCQAVTLMEPGAASP